MLDFKLDIICCACARCIVYVVCNKNRGGEQLMQWELNVKDNRRSATYYQKIYNTHRNLRFLSMRWLPMRCFNDGCAAASKVVLLLRKLCFCFQLSAWLAHSSITLAIIPNHRFAVYSCTCTCACTALCSARPLHYTIIPMDRFVVDTCTAPCLARPLHNYIPMDQSIRCRGLYLCLYLQC